MLWAVGVYGIVVGANVLGLPSADRSPVPVRPSPQKIAICTITKNGQTGKLGKKRKISEQENGQIRANAPPIKKPKPQKIILTIKNLPLDTSQTL